MKQTSLISLLFMLLMLSANTLRADEPVLEPVAKRAPHARAFLLGVGRTRQLDTYLSPMNYSGLQVSLLAQSERMTHLARRHVSFQSTFHAVFTSTDNPAGSANYIGGRLAYDAGWHYHWSPVRNLDLKAGGLLGTDLGFLYNDRNGNNPAQGHFSVDLSLSAGAAYKFNLWQKPFRLAYQADMPLLGMMFSPEFGQSYYEISQQGAGHNLLCSHPANALSLRQLLALDIILPRITLRVGYLFDIRQQNVHEIRYRDSSHSLMFGIVRHFQLLKRMKQ